MADTKKKIIFQVDVETDAAEKKIDKFIKKVDEATKKVEETTDKTSNSTEQRKEAKARSTKTKEIKKQEKANQKNYASLSDMLKTIDTVEKAEKLANKLMSNENPLIRKENLRAVADYFKAKQDWEENFKKEITGPFEERLTQIENEEKALKATSNAYSERTEQVNRSKLSTEELTEEVKNSIRFTKKSLPDTAKEVERLNQEIKRITDLKKYDNDQLKYILEPLQRAQGTALSNLGWGNAPSGDPEYKELLGDLDAIVEKEDKAAKEADEFSKALERANEAASRHKDNGIIDKWNADESIRQINASYKWTEEQKKQLTEPFQKVIDEINEAQNKVFEDAKKNSEKVLENVEKTSKVPLNNVKNAFSHINLAEEDRLIKDIDKVVEKDAKGVAVSIKEVESLLTRVSAQVAKANSLPLHSEESDRISEKFRGRYNQLWDIAQRARAVGEEADKSAKKISTLAERWDRLNNTAKKSNLETSMKGFNRSLKKGALFMIRYIIGFRSMFYLVRAIRNVITQGLKEFRKFDPETNKTMTNLSNKFTELKSALTSSFAQIAQIAEPALMKLMDLLIKIQDYMGMFFAALQGKDYYKKAIAAQKTYAEALEDTSEAAKKTKNYLSGLDEIRVYDTGSDTSSSKSSGSGTEPMMTGVENVAIPSWIQKISEFIRTAISNIRKWVSDAWQWIKTVFQEAGEWVGTILEEIGEHWGWVGDLISTAWGIIKPILEAWWEALKAFWGWIWENVIKRGFDGLKNFFMLIGDLLGKFWTFYKDTWTNIIERLKNAFEIIKYILTHIPEVIAAVWASIKNTAATVWNAVSTFFVNLFNKIRELLGTGASNALEKVREFKDKAIESFNNLKSGALEKFGAIKDGLKEKITNIKTTVTDAFEKIRTTVMDKVSLIKNGVVDRFNNIRSSIENIIQRIKSLFSFNWEFPRIKVPHFNVYQGQSVLGITLPRIDVSWDYLAKGGILDGATWLGGNKIAGEAGKEAVIPLERNTEWIRKIADEIADILTDRLGAILNRYPMPEVAMGNLIPPKITVEIGELDGVERKLDTIIDSLNNRSGGTYNFSAQINRKTLFQEVINEAKVSQSTTGRNPFLLA